MTFQHAAYILSALLLTRLCLAQAGDSIPVFLPEDSSRVQVRRLNINSDKSDFSPVLLNNTTLFFASARPSRLGVSYANERNIDVTDLFYAERRDSVNFGKARPFVSINSKYNEGPFTLASNGNLIYFSGNAGNEKREKGKTQQLQIYVSEKINGKWTKPTTAGFCNTDYANCHPALSANNSLLVFCSDMPGGYGGTDLYYTQLKEGTWSTPVNFGPTINSAANELFPFLSGSSVLYFSSNRSSGAGGLDIYKVDLTDSAGGKVEALLPPINTAFDDFGIWLDSTGRSGYLSSSRLSKTGDDIYYFSAVYPDFTKSPTPPVKTKFCYTFFEENAYPSTDSVSMTYEWDFGNGEKIRSEKCRYCFSKPGDYPIMLNVVEKNSGEVFYNQVTYTLTVDAPPQLKINCSDTALACDELLIDALNSSLKGYQLVDFYWDFGDGTYNRGKFAKHSYKEPGAYTIELGVRARNEATQKTELFKIEKNIIIKESI